MRAAGLVTSLAPITSATSVRANSPLMSSISLSLSYGHVGLGEQHVHVAGHAAGDRVDARTAPRRRASRARPRGRRPRAGPGRPPCRSRARRRPGARRRAGSRRRRRSWSAPCRRRRAPRAPAPPAPTPAKNTLAIERFIASAICLVRIEPDAPTSMPATISAVLSSAMPAAAARQAGERVQRRDHDRHVGAADRQHGEHAERAGADAGSARTAARDSSRRRSRPPAPTAISAQRRR